MRSKIFKKNKKGDVVVREEKVIYKCDRCGSEIDKLIFASSPLLFRSTISATQYELTKYGYLADKKSMLPDADVIVLEGVVGYNPTGIRKIHLCKKCSKDFKKFMNT